MAIEVPYNLNIQRIHELIPDLVLEVAGNRFAQVNKISSLGDLEDGVLAFCSKPELEVDKIFEKFRGCIVLIGANQKAGSDANTWVKVKNPRLAFARLVPRPSQQVEIHPSAVIDPNAKLGKNIKVGAQSYIGKATLGDDVVIGSCVVIEDGVILGNRVTIKSGTVIGGSGFGFEKDSNGKYHEFYHWGRVVIEDDVQIGSNCCVDRGALGDTVVKKGVKTDNFVHIAHNCVVGENSILTAMTELSGSVKVGQNVWFAPCSSVINGVSIGDNAFLGIGSICTQNLEAEHRLIPAFSTPKPPKHSASK